ncbi:acetyl-CoA carboxylase family protein [Phreatobacter sp. AB_2022a]|uniref:acetyl-CoA carboxylase family protein n=1 Tax=Phreatobacter sp. AB_2022a TaxID=3003134 RepID=UPI002287222A|nr:carboxyl transferase domain-containing protein [Phreatobacter sp. AB_2022a]MCZ0734863.1 ATP-grasp domain-containing protein [Phreatobacter sp. AB_2022a]
MFRKVLIANRGEIAVRIARAANELGIATVAVFAPEDALSLHVTRADSAVALPGAGAAAYLDIRAIVDAAVSAGCDAVHPGYGFLAENAGFARAVAAAGLTFVGPGPETLERFGDKGAARRLARETGVPLAAGTEGATSLAEAEAFMASLGGRPIMVKAVAGGGGRGMRVVERAADLAEAYRRAASEAQAAFGSDALYVEELIRPARHVEIQVLGDVAGAVMHLFERECSLQRRHQKLVEIAPAPGLDPVLREAVAEAAVRLARAAGTRTLCTVEFLVDADAGRFVFMEANPRLQVEHTVTEEVMGVDLVQAQFGLAAGRSLAELGLTQEAVGKPRGLAVQLRVNMERIGPDGAATPTGGTLTAFDPPGGAGIRVESFGYAGYRTSASFDSLIAKVIAFTPTGRLEDALVRADRALAEFRIGGVGTNKAFLRGLIQRPDIRAGAFDTGFVERHAAELVAAAAAQSDRSLPADAGASATPAGRAVAAPAGTVGVPAPMGGRVVSFEVAEGDAVKAGAAVAVIEAMKMEHLVMAETSGIVRLIAGAPGDNVAADQPLVFIEPGDVAVCDGGADAAHGPGHVRADLAEALARNEALLDHQRPDAVARRRRTGQRTARENIADLCDDDSFVEYGGLALAAQRRRRTLDELMAMSPADGLVAGIGAVNGALFDETKARCLIMSYDYTVFAGTQGFMNHKKMDRMLRLAGEWRLPVVVFAEGGGGRPGETDFMGVAGLDVPTFRMLATLSGTAPTIAIVSGRCFAGNAAIAGCCDLIIATENANLGMGGPAMIEGGGLGVFRPEEVGPMSVQAPNGVVDLLVKDEAAAVAAAKQYLAYFQGPVADWRCADQDLLRQAIPENRLRAYDIRTVVELIADTGSVMELRPAHGVGMITALIRVEGRPLGLIANNPRHLGGAIDAEGAEKGARFIELCETYGLPVLSLCDTPGFMVGPEAETTGLVRRVARLFLSGANATVPMLTIVLRKGYGLGAQGMAAGSFQAPLFIVSWPTGEFGGMGLEGAVRLGYRNELAAIADADERQAVYERHVAELYERGKAVSMASFLEIDGVIDPAQSRHWIMRALKSVPKQEHVGKRRAFVAPR